MNESKLNKPMADILSNNVLNKRSFMSKMLLSQPSKVLAFLSRHKYHITQRGIALQITRFRCCPNLPCQQANKSTTLLGITHWIPNKLNTISHKSQAMAQWRNKWSTISSSTLHIQHQPTKIIFRRLKLIKS